MVVNIGRVKSGKWEYVENDIRAVNRVVVNGGASLKVIFENDCECGCFGVIYVYVFMFLLCFTFGL